MMGVGSWIARRRAIAPASTAIISDEGALTYADLDDRIARLANALLGHGVGSGDRVAFLGPNHVAFLELFFAAGTIGAVPLPVNYRLEPDEVRFVLEDSSPGLIVHAAELRDLASGHGSVRTCIALEDEYEGFLASGAPDRPLVTVGFDDPALISYTSGTTGHPKGVVLTHANLTFNVMNFLIAGDFRAHDVSLAIAPFFRVGGLAVTLLETLVVGGTVVVMGAFEPERALRLVEQHRVTVLFGGPELLGALEADPAFSHVDFSSVRVCYTGGAPVPEPMLRRFLARGIPVLQGYGLSEAGPWCSCSTPTT